MMKRKASEPKIKVETTAKAEISAKVVRQRKHLIEEVIPPDVTRAKAGAWLDLISPLTEWAGLRGDQLRRKRELLRVQQDDSACTKQVSHSISRESVAGRGRFRPLQNLVNIVDLSCH